MFVLSAPKLSICIATHNRAEFIGETLEKIISQATSECEIVIVDGASTDNTEQVVAGFVPRFRRLRYVRQLTNNGVDRDFDRAVELASGEYCWLFSDDDLIKPDGIATVMRALEYNFSLILVNGEHRDFSMSTVRVASYFGIESNRRYAANELDRLFVDVGTCLICICCVVIRRETWLKRERRRYYGSRFVHVGVIFQDEMPGETLVLAEPVMSLRLGNRQTWATETFQVWYINWPALVWSLALSEATKKCFCAAEPWRRFGYLLPLRAKGRYSLTEYTRWVRPRLRSRRSALVPYVVATLPCWMAYVLYVLYSSVLGKPRSPDDAFWTILPRSLRALQRSRE